MNVELFVDLKSKMHTFKDSTHDLIIYQNYLLTNIGYEVHTSSLDWIYYDKEKDQYYFNLNAYFHSIKNTNALYFLGGLKYPQAGDHYSIKLSCPAFDLSQDMILEDGIKNLMPLPCFPAGKDLRIYFKIIEFGTISKALVNKTLSLDYDIEASRILQKTHFSEEFKNNLPPCLKDNDFLRKLPKRFGTHTELLLSDWLLLYNSYLGRVFHHNYILIRLKKFIDQKTPPVFQIKNGIYFAWELKNNPYTFKDTLIILKSVSFKSLKMIKFLISLQKK